MEDPSYPYVAWKCLNGDKSDNIKALLKPKKAMEAATNPEILKKFLDIEENRANLAINKQLIELSSIPEEELILKDGIKNFDKLKDEFVKLKFDSITNDVSWNKYVKTFDCIKY
jgi:hypothetical protein